MTKAEKPKVPVAIGETGVMLRSLEEAWRFASIVAASGIAPRGMETPEKIFISLQAGMEVGLKPWQAVQAIAVVNNRPTMWGDTLIGLVLASGLLEYQKDWEEGTGESLCVYYEVKRKGHPEPKTTQFSWADAKRANLAGKDTYKQHPRRMLFNRARAFALRDLFADVLKGIGIREEVEEYDRPAAVARPAIGRPRPRLSDLADSPKEIPPAPEEPLPGEESQEDPNVVDGEVIDAEIVEEPHDDAGEESQEEHVDDEGEVDIFGSLMGTANDESVPAPTVRKNINFFVTEGTIDRRQADEVELALQHRIDRVKAAANSRGPSNHGAAAVARGKEKKAQARLLDTAPDGSEAYRQ